MEALRISDLTTTVGFLTTTYRVRSWPGAIARRRETMIGGRGPYDEVDETIEITISNANVMDSLATIEQLFDQACKWGQGEGVSPVYIDYQPTSTAGYYRAVIVGPPDSGPMIELPENFVMSPTVTVLDGVVLRFKRQGLWLNTTTVTGTSASTTNGYVATISGLTATPVPSPARLALTSTTPMANTRGVRESFLLMTCAATTAAASARLLVEAASQGTSVSGYYTTAADATGLAPGGAVLRYTPADTEGRISGLLLEGTVDTNANRWGMWVSYRNNGDTAFTVRALITDTDIRLYTPPVYIEAGASAPQWIYLGSLSPAVRFTSRGFLLEITASDTAGTIDFGAAAMMALDKPDTDRVVHIESAASVWISTNITFDHRMLTHLGPEVYSTASSFKDLVYPYTGDAALYINNAAVAVAWLATDLQSARWVATTAGTTAIANTFVLTQHVAGVTPE